MKIKLAYYDGDRELHETIYNDVQSIRAGRAAELLNKSDCDGNGIKYNAPILQIVLSDGNTATYDMNNIVVLPA